jgi:hypothetical protein
MSNEPRFAWDPRDTAWNEFHREHGMMTNREFFSSNGPGGFYEGMVWDEENNEWVKSDETLRKERELEVRLGHNICSGCGHMKKNCECDTRDYDD